MSDNLPIISDPQKCTGCGLCALNCPTRSIDMTTGKATFSGSLCLNCGHCQAICPSEAISGALPSPGVTPFETFSPGNNYISPGKFDTASLFQLMASRRSIRRFTDKHIDPAIIRDLIRIGITAPSATNCQSWTFKIIPDATSVAALSQRVGDVYRRFCLLSKWKSLRIILRLAGQPELDHFHQVYGSYMLDRLNEWDKGGSDPFFHNAPAAIIISSPSGAYMHSDDAHMAAQNILLAAHAMGLGTCLIGLALLAFRRAPMIARSINIPQNEITHSVIALGYPDVHYQRLTGRAEPDISIEYLK